jgi:hypothetical protein
MADLLERVQRELDERLAQLRPLVEEARQLEAALEALEHGEDSARARRRERPVTPTGVLAELEQAQRPVARAKPAAEQPPAKDEPQPRESDGRRRRVLAVITENPGTTAGTLALLLDTSIPAMGALLKRLEREGEIQRAEKGYERRATPSE